tara:strand:- start:7192 stop:9261 length:2070 start_codon:yes stop_codon:yes gene_type:complete
VSSDQDFEESLATNHSTFETVFTNHWRLILLVIFLLLLGGFNPSSGFTVFAFFLVVWVVSIRKLHDSGTLEKYNLDLIWGRSFLMWRTERGKDIIEKLSKYKKFWNIFADVGLVVVFFIMALMLFLLIWQATLVSQIPKSAAVSPKMLIGLPGLNPVIPVGYGVLSLSIAVIIHEFSHGILGRVAKIKLKALGLLFFIFPVGAFVEPDEEEMMNMRRRERMRLYAAGPASNIALALIFSILFSWVMVGSLQPVENGALISGVVQDYSADEAGLESWMLITSIDNQTVTDSESFSVIMDNTTAGQNITIEAYSKEGSESFTATLSDKGDYFLEYYPEQYNSSISGKGFLGVATTNPEVITDLLAHPVDSGGAAGLLAYMTLPFAKLQPFPDHFTSLFAPEGITSILPDNLFWIVANSFYWIFWLNLMVGMTNVLPAIPLDGGFIFGDGLSALMEKRRKGLSAEERELIVEKSSTFFTLLVVSLVVFQVAGPKLFGTESIDLEAVITVDSTDGFAGENLSFSASNSRGDLINYLWDFGDDSNVSTGISVSHTFASGGVYEVSLTVVDETRLSARTFIVVSIDDSITTSGQSNNNEVVSLDVKNNAIFSRIEVETSPSNTAGVCSMEISVINPEGISETIEANSAVFEYENLLNGTWDVRMRYANSVSGGPCGPTASFSYNLDWNIDYQADL